jgi:thiol-disulfide isomerase/thioredoxin
MKFWMAAAATVLMLVATGQAQVKVGDKPTLQFTSVSGEQVDLAQYRGKLVTIDFWATWCGPCMAYAPHLVELNRKYHDKGLQILGISLDDTAAIAAKGAKDHGFTWPIACDGKAFDSPIAKDWGVDAAPAMFLLSPEGVVLWSGEPGQFEAELTDAFAKHPPTKTAAGNLHAAAATAMRAK